MKRPAALLAAACLLSGLIAGVSTAPAEAAGRTVSAKTLLAKLTVRAEDHSHRYNRSVFSYDDDFDADGDGCYTRKEVLKRDALRLTKLSKSCSVDGEWRSLYDGRVYDDPADLQIDHLVALAEAWHSGAYAWSHRRQIAFGNDVGYKWDLQAVSVGDNQNKGDLDPAEWLPSKNRCTYAKAWIGVKYRWNLPVDRAEKAALTRQLAKCDSLQVLKPGKPDIAALVGHGEIEPIKKV